MEAERLVFIDETWAKTNMTRTHGWAPRGERLLDKVPHGHWKTTTFLAALRHDRIDAPCLFDGPINGECFRAYVEQFLAPTLAPGDVSAEFRGLAVKARSGTSASRVLTAALSAATWVPSQLEATPTAAGPRR